MGGENGPKDQVSAAISAATDAIELAMARIRAIDDPVQAFHYASQLWFQLRTTTDSNGRDRQRLAARVAGLHPELDLTALAKLLSTPDHPLKKARAGQLVADGNRLLNGDAP